jgi:hypothetical protein
MNKSFSFLTVGKTSESTEAGAGYSKYIGLASCKVLAVNPDAKKLEEIYGREMPVPDYSGEKDGVKWARVDVILNTDPDANNDIDTIAKATFFLRNEPAINREGTRQQVIDVYGNTTYGDIDDVKEKKPLLTSNGNPAKIGPVYRPTYNGEADLVAFLKAFLVVPDAFTFPNGKWELGPKADEGKFGLDNIKDYFNGNVKEVKDAIALQPNNKVKMLFGVRTNPDDNKQYQDVCTRGDLILPNYSNALDRLEKRLTDAKANGSFPNTEYKVCVLQEYKVEASDLDKAAESGSAMPWD